MVEEEEGSCSLSQRREGAKALSGIAEKIWRTYFCSYEPTDYVLHGEDCCIGCVENSWPCCFVYQQVWVFWMEVSTRHVIGMGKGTKTHLSEGWRWWDVWGGIARMMFSLTASWRRPRSSCEEWESKTRSWGRLGPLFGMNTCQNHISRKRSHIEALSGYFQRVPGGGGWESIVAKDSSHQGVLPFPMHIGGRAPPWALTQTRMVTFSLELPVLPGRDLTSFLATAVFGRCSNCFPVSSMFLMRSGVRLWSEIS